MSKWILAVVAAVAVASGSVAAQWPKIPDPTVPRTADGKINYDAPAPRMADGHPDFSGIWMRADSAPPRPPRGGGAGNRGRNVILEGQTERFPNDPSGPPVATFGEAGANMEGGLPFTQWAKDLKAARKAIDYREQPDANCHPMGQLQFLQQPQPRKIMFVDRPVKMMLIQFEANWGLWQIYLDGRKLPPQGEPQPWWWGYSVGHWEGDTLVVETNNLRGAEDSPNDGWLDVNGSPYSNQTTLVTRIHRPTFGHMTFDMTVNDPKGYTKPWTVRVDERLTPDQELIEFNCEENQQLGRRIKLQDPPK